MSAYDVQVPRTKFSLIEWRKPDDRPKENDRCLVIVGADIHPARFVGGAFYTSNWQRASLINAWAAWPKPPVT